MSKVVGVFYSLAAIPCVVGLYGTINMMSRGQFYFPESLVFSGILLGAFLLRAAKFEFGRSGVSGVILTLLAGNFFVLLLGVMIFAHDNDVFFILMTASLILCCFGYIYVGRTSKVVEKFFV